MSNPYFLNSYNESNHKEHSLYKNASHEIVESFGRNFLYLSKTLIDPDYVLGEDPAMEFNSAVSITLFIENFEGYSGQGDLFSKFGLTIDDRLELIVQQEHFQNLIGKEPEIDDIIYDTVSNQIFKLNYVTPDMSFNQFVGQNMTYKLHCILYKYSHETLNTNVTEIDAISTETDVPYQNEVAQLTSGGLEIIDFTDDDYFGNK